jgi:hypothetical protein
VAEDLGFNPNIFSSTKVDANLEPKHWFALGGALRATQIALLVGCLGCGLVSLGMIADTLRANPALGDWLTARTISLLNLWGSAGIVLGWAMLLAGWSACFSAWPLPERRFLRAATWAAVAAIIVVLLVMSLRVFGFLTGSLGAGSTEDAATMPTVIIVIGSLGCAAALIPFNFYLSDLQKQIGHDHLRLPPVIYATVVGTLTLWCIIARLLIPPSTAFKAWLIVLSTLATFICEFLWLWLLNSSVSRDLRVSQAWKRL